MYRGQIDRLTKEIADLEAKIADQHGRAAKERAAALAAASSITRYTSPSTARSKLAEQVRRQTQAADHDKRAAAFSAQLAGKRASLTSAMGSAERAEATTRRRDEASADRRRRDELRHIAELERRRREVSRPIFASIPAPVVRRAKEGGERVDFKYDVCLSFAGEQRGYVELVATGLKARGMRVFYDQDEQIDLWGKDLAEHFDRVYRIESRYCVMNRTGFRGDSADWISGGRTGRQ